MQRRLQVRPAILEGAGGGTHRCPVRSLVEARQMIDDEVDDIPDDFIFVLAGAIAILLGFRSAAFWVVIYPP